MATQKRPLPNADVARADTVRTIRNIFDEPYVQLAFENLGIPSGIDGTGASANEVWTADGNGGGAFVPNSGSGLLSYKGFLFQSGTNNPAHTILLNTLGVGTWRRDGVGTYSIDIPGNPDIGHFGAHITTSGDPTYQYLLAYSKSGFPTQTSRVTIGTYANGILTDGILINAYITIEVPI